MKVQKEIKRLKKNPAKATRRTAKKASKRPKEVAADLLDDLARHPESLGALLAQKAGQVLGTTKRTRQALEAVTTGVVTLAVTPTAKRLRKKATKTRTSALPRKAGKAKKKAKPAKRNPSPRRAKRKRR
jgi:hypothetical protein